MLKFIKHHMESIAGIEVWPVLSFIIFFLFFLAVLWWVFTVRRAHIDHMASLPLGDSARRIGTLVILLGIFGTPAIAQDGAASPTSPPVVQVTNTVNYLMLALAILQTVFILSLSGILRTFMGTSKWIKDRKGARNATLLLLPLFLVAAQEANAQAYVPEREDLSGQQLFWLLLVVNVVFFIILLVQLNLLRGMTRFALGGTEVAQVSDQGRPAWISRVMQALTRRPSEEKEPDLLLHHEYDGIRELDNVLPPWWLWLFYGTVIWGIVYLVNVHVIDVWPDQKEAYEAELQQAQLDVAAFVALQGSLVDENNLTASSDPAVINSGEALFNQFCVACHNAGGQGAETSVGPNLTDPYWINGGGAKNIFKTIKYGVAEKGMISWKSQLKPDEMAALTSYILSRAGTGDAAQKAPQGELWTGSIVPADSSAAPADTAGLAAQ